MHSLTRPMTFEPILVPKPWGGRKLESLGKSLPDGESYGESWEIADLPLDAVTSSAASRTVVDFGPSAGSTLREMITQFGDELLGRASPTVLGDFPLLVKYLDAEEHLSVQVHPDEEFVDSHPGSNLKTESWYVVEAEPEAILYLGLRQGVALTDVERCLGKQEMVDMLVPVRARVGEFHHLPAGTVHALGAGVVVAEIQTPSDTTFRLYDWTEEYGRAPRALHLAEGLEAIHVGAAADSLPPTEEDGQRVLVETRHYSIFEHRSSLGTIELSDRSELRIVMVVAGELVVSTSGHDPVRLAAGRTAIVPAGAAQSVELEVIAPATVLEISLV